jgi:purine-nucleoside phosphorylase
MSTDPSFDPQTDRAVRFLTPKLPFAPTVGLVLGSGLGPYADRPPTRLVVPYADIPGFPRCGVEGHTGRLVLSDRCGPGAAMLQGRVHRYEGVSLDEVTRPVRVLAALGVRTLLVTCAAGSLDGAEPGSLMLIEDHLNLMGDNPLIGRTAPGVARFVEMAEAYDAGLRDMAAAAAAEAGLALRRGVLAALTGPTFETAAEAAMLRRLGAQAVSMSVVPEVIAARALGLKVLGLALLTNESGASLKAGGSHESVLAAAGRQTDAVGRLLDGILRRLGGETRL